jgi:hypothetical protein
MAKKRETDDIAPEYDFSKGVRGKYAGRFASGSNVAVIDKDLVAIFPDSEAINRTLRLVAKLRELPTKPVRRRKASAVKVAS